MCSFSGVDDNSLVRFYGAGIRASTGVLRPRQLLRHGRWFEFGTIRWVGVEHEGDEVGHRRMREDVSARAGGGGAGCGGAADGDAYGMRRCGGAYK